MQRAWTKLYQAAAHHGVKLTEHRVAIARSIVASRELDVQLEIMRRDGTMRLFNREFAARRRAAQAEGRGFPPMRTC